eukprot:NODE_26809_length_537_cov_1.543902.p3 GENE.NODE_26809_length_537_cov_1.543902~~NODE_26809_length_537_cov_1.543902.p3  ORF type:complete len:62 (+),score=39.57 NODE_26809_length_537_cov_1.543902:301-486(+)
MDVGCEVDLTISIRMNIGVKKKKKKKKKKNHSEKQQIKKNKNNQKKKIQNITIKKSALKKK